MISIFPHPDLEKLLGALLEAIRTLQARRTGLAALRPIPVVVPSIQLKDWLQVAIARRNGLCMGLDFMTPQGLVARVLSLGRPAEHPTENPWVKSRLTWRILPHLEDYLAQLGVRNPAPRDRLALASLLADQFDQYGHFRPGIIANWNRQTTAAGPKWSLEDRENEAWQRELWERLAREMEAGGQPSLPPALELEEFSRNDAFLKALTDAFPELFVLGTGVLDPLLVSVLAVLGKAGCDVHAHMVLPSLGYLGELRKSARQVEQDPEAMEMCDGHPLLVSMGRHAVGSFFLLGKLDENYRHWPDPGESDTSAGTLLARLQDDIRGLRMPLRAEFSADDKSLQIHSCFGPRREMEVLRDELLRAFREIPGLQPEEVLVVAPELETYAPLVSAILEPVLPVRLTELPRSEQDPVAEALLALLEMAGGRCEASSLIELLHLRAVRARLGIPDSSEGIDRLRDWIDQSGLTHGLGEEDDSAGSWRFARNRMVAGNWFGPDGAARYPVGESVHPTGEFVLPVAGELGGDAELRENFLGWHWRLASRLQEWKSPAPAAVWSRRLLQACGELLGDPADDDARLNVQAPLTFLGHTGCAEPLDAAAILDWLQTEFAEGTRRAPVSGRVTFGRIKQLQNIPCRVLAMVGMQDTAFPRQNRVPAWDLLHCDPRVWDRNARIDDRQLFLDALLTPSERLIITAANRNVRSGKTEPFSSCVDELLRVVGVMRGGTADLVFKHRLQPFTPDYFQLEGGTLPASFDAQGARVAESLLRSTAEATPFWTGAITSPAPREPIEITVAALARFWKDPAAAFLKAQGIAAAREEGDDELLDRSPLQLDPLQRWAVRNAILEGILQGDWSPDYTKALFSANRGLPAAELGERLWGTLHEAAGLLGEKIRGFAPEPLPVECVLTGSGPAIRVTGSLLRAKHLEEDVLLFFRIGKLRTEHFLKAWIESVVAASAGHRFKTCLLDDEKLDAPLILPETAPGHLGELIGGYLEGQLRPLCYAPATSEAYAKACESWETVHPGALAAAAEKWNKQDFNGTKGEGLQPAATLAWRDQDPFELADDWHRWAAAIARPLGAWK